jgi:ABC-2 type transport system permease protein
MTCLRVMLAKEWLDLMRNRAALVPVLLVAIVTVALPFVIAVAIPAATGERLGEDADLIRVATVSTARADVAPDARVQAFLFEQFLLLFLMAPMTGAMTLAAHSVVGEKLARTLEPLLATPIRTTELLVAKMLGALLPTLAISVAALALYVAGIVVLAEPGVLAVVVNARSIALVALVGPATALVALQLTVLVSSRVNDPRTAQQVGVLLIVPLVGLMIAQFTSLLALSAHALVLIGLALGGIWLVLLAGSAAAFSREAVLTRWR